MRLSTKYKIYKKSTSVSFKFPLRIFKFLRPKWKRIQRNLLLSQKTLPLFINPFFVKNTLNAWEKVNTVYKAGFFIKNNIYKFLDSTQSKSAFKKHLFFYKKTITSDIYIASVVRAHFRLDFLLQNSNLFLTSYQARQSINNKQVTANGKSILGNYTVKQGDIISFSTASENALMSLETVLKMNSSNNHFLTFLEIDHYTKTIVILKDFNDLTQEDFYLLMYEHFDLKKFKDYL